MEYPDLTPFQNLMMALFMCSRKDDEHVKWLGQLVRLLSDEGLDYTQADRQLFRELYCGRLGTADTLLVYQTLVDRRGYIMTGRDLEAVRHFFDLWHARL